MRNVHVQEVYYGALEMTDRQTKLTPVLRLDTLLRMRDWTEAMAAYEASGNYGVFSRLLQHDGMAAEHARKLEKAAHFERTSNPVLAKEQLTGIHEHLQKHQSLLCRLFRNALVKHINWFRQPTLSECERELADRYLQRKDHLHASIYLHEAYISWLTWQQHGDANSFDDRKAATDNAELNANAKKLRHLRNAMAHGVLSDDRSIQPLLRDPKELSNKLRELRKRLFS